MPTFNVTGLLAIGDDHHPVHQPAPPHPPLVLLVEATNADGETVELSPAIGDDFGPSGFATIAAGRPGIGGTDRRGAGTGESRACNDRPGHD
jgi:hypothetical protein